MDIRSILSKRVEMGDVLALLSLLHESDEKKQELYDIVFDEDEKIGYHAAWILTHLSSVDNRWLYPKQNELIEEVMTCKHGGKRRVILNLLYKQPYPDSPRTDFLDFCLERVPNGKELPAVQSLCVKITYELTLPIPELIQELKVILDMLDVNTSPAVRSVRRKVLKSMHKRKSLQKF